MDGIGTLHGQLAYALVAVLFAMGTIVAAHHLRAGRPPSAAVETAAALTAGALWPVMVVGLVQLWAVRCLVARLGAEPGVAPELADGTEQLVPAR